MGKKFISNKMKLFMLALFLLSITLYASGCIVLAQSGYKLSDYSNEINITPNSFKSDVNFFDFNNSSMTNEYPINDNITEISLNLNSQDIKVENYEGQTLKVQIKSNSSISSELPETEDGNKLILSTKYDTPSDATITLSIPNNFNNKGTLKLVTSSGDIQVSNLSLDRLNISTASGETKVSNLNLNYYSSDSSSGDSHFSNLSILNETKLSSSSGELVGNGNFGKVTANTTSGDIDIKFEKFLNNSSLSSSSGSISLSLPKNLGYKINYETTSGDLHSSSGKLSAGDESSIINVNTTSGDLNIK
jgi:lia operon protein LiaG